MSYQPNSNLFMNPAKVRSTATTLAIFGPSTAANMGGTVFTVPDNATGDIDFIVKWLSSETIGVTISDDGTNYSDALIPVVATTGLDAAAATLGNATYTLEILRFGSPKYVKFTKSSTSETCTIACCVSNVVASHAGL